MGGGRSSGTPRRLPERRFAGAGPDDCNIALRISLSAVQTSRSADLRPADELNLEIVESGGWSTLACVGADGRAVGFVLGPGSAELMECIQKGATYCAEIVEIDYGLVTVSIRRKT